MCHTSSSSSSSSSSSPPAGFGDTGGTASAAGGLGKSSIPTSALKSVSAFSQSSSSPLGYTENEQWKCISTRALYTHLRLWAKGSHTLRDNLKGTKNHTCAPFAVAFFATGFLLILAAMYIPRPTEYCQDQGAIQKEISLRERPPIGLAEVGHGCRVRPRNRGVFLYREPLHRRMDQ